MQLKCTHIHVVLFLVVPLKEHLTTSHTLTKALRLISDLSRVYCDSWDRLQPLCNPELDEWKMMGWRFSHNPSKTSVCLSLQETALRDLRTHVWAALPQEVEHLPIRRSVVRSLASLVWTLKHS